MTDIWNHLIDEARRRAATFDRPFTEEEVFAFAWARGYELSPEAFGEGEFERVTEATGGEMPRFVWHADRVGAPSPHAPDAAAMLLIRRYDRPRESRQYYRTVDEARAAMRQYAPPVWHARLVVWDAATK